MKLNRILFLLLFTVYIPVVLALATAKITIKVIDEKGQPVEGANAGLVLEVPKKKGQGWGTNTSWIPGLTDSDGVFIGEGKTAGYVGLSARKAGYYDVSGHFKDFTGVSGILGFKKYKPWNPTVEIVLKKKINPIAMYALKMFGLKSDDYPQLPFLDHYIGFDLMANDWVVPYGLGTHRDFLFKVDVNRAISNRDHDVTLTLKFPNEGDGLIKYTPDSSKGKSALRLPYHAPTSGYIPEFKRRYKNKPGVLRYAEGGNPEYDINYFFRIRTHLDKDGNVTSGLYGKIHGEISLGNYAWLHTGKPYVVFNYYLNPNDNDTNIEFDLEKNLFENLPDRQKVKNP